jgi:hypothetical protein
MQAVDALPASLSTVASWIHTMFDYFEPEIIEEIHTAKSRISISFDGWGSKREKLSVVGVVVYFIDSLGVNVTRLIGLPELPGHGKSGVGTCFSLLFYRIILTISYRSSFSYPPSSYTFWHYFFESWLLRS